MKRDSAPHFRSYLKEQGSRSGISINFVSNLDETLIAPDLALALFRIAQEALTNAIRYSGAQLILVSLDRNDDKVGLLIRQWSGHRDSTAGRIGPASQIGHPRHARTDCGARRNAYRPVHERARYGRFGPSPLKTA